MMMTEKDSTSTFLRYILHIIRLKDFSFFSLGIEDVQNKEIPLVTKLDNTEELKYVTIEEYKKLLTDYESLHQAKGQADMEIEILKVEQRKQYDRHTTTLNLAKGRYQVWYYN